MKTNPRCGTRRRWEFINPKGRARTPCAPSNRGKENYMSVGTILLIVLILLLIGAFPAWPHSRSWGYAPSGTLGTVLLIVLILVLLGWI